MLDVKHVPTEDKFAVAIYTGAQPHFLSDSNCLSILSHLKATHVVAADAHPRTGSCLSNVTIGAIYTSKRSRGIGHLAICIRGQANYQRLLHARCCHLHYTCIEM